MKRAAIQIGVALALPALAFATEESGEATRKAPESGAKLEVLAAKICASIDNKECTAEQETFHTGDKAWLWLKLRPKDESTTLSLKWSRNGEHVWSMDPTPARLGRTWYYKTLDQPGEWQVELLDNDQTVLHTAKMTVSGEPVDEARTSPGGEATNPATGTSDHVEVIDLKLAETIEDREPVGPTTTFAAGSKVYTWVKLNVKAPETAVKFKWYKGDALVYTSNAISVKHSPAWRTWLSKTVDETGAWKVEVVDADDKAIRRAQFTVQ